MSDSLRKALGMEEEPSSAGTEIAKRQKQAVAKAEELAEQIRKELNQAWSYYRLEVHSYMRMGGLLIQAKDAVPHGAWEEWISNNFPFTSRTASSWMRLFRERDKVEEYLNQKHVSDSLSMREVLKAIGPPKSPKPEPAVSEAQEEPRCVLRGLLR